MEAAVMLGLLGIVCIAVAVGLRYGAGALLIFGVALVLVDFIASQGRG